jgi:thymidylate kinase
MIHSFTGTHGVGKSTSVFDTAHKLKLSEKDKTVAVLMEVAKESPFAINKQTTPSSQMWIFTSQFQKELELMNRFHIVVTDRTVFDSIAYTKVAGFKDLADKMFELALYHAPIYTKIYFKLIKNNDFLINDGVRIIDRTFRQNVEDELIGLYDEARKRLPINFEYI